MSDKPEISAMADEFAAETREWLESFDALLAANGPERAHQLLEEMLEHARQQSLDMPFSATTGYVNSIEPGEEAHSPGNLELEGRLRAYMRWNAMAMVVKANRLHPEDGGDLGDTSPHSRLWRICLPRALITFGTRPTRSTAVTCFTSKATVRRVCTPARFWKVD